MRLSAENRLAPRYGAGGDFLGSSLSLARFVADGPESGKAAAKADIQKLMTPAPTGQIEAWLAELSVIAPKRVGDEFEESLRLTAYTSRLSDFPADVVRYALLERPWRFWPSWAELEAACREAVSSRVAMLKALEASAEKPAEAKRREPLTAERAGEIVAEIFGASIEREKP